MKVFIITEGNKKTGFGHITRCTALYQAFEEKGIIPEFIVNGDRNSEDLLSGKRYKIYNWLSKKRYLLDSIKNAEIVIVDSYLAGKDLYDKISETVKTPVYLDDNRRLDYPRGIILNGAIYAKKLNYHRKRDTTYLLGGYYVLQRKEFWNIPPKKPSQKVKNILITAGGCDIRNITPKVLDIIVKKYPDLTKNVVIGRGFRNQREIRRAADSKTHLIMYPDAENMRNLMLESDIAVSAGGQTLYELAGLRIPTAAIVTADNQLNNITGLEKAGYILSAGWWDDRRVMSNIISRVSTLIAKHTHGEKNKERKPIINGSGALKAVEQCLKKYLNKNIVIRNVGLKDIRSIYKLSNAREVRRASFEGEKIDYEQHKKWFNKKLNDKNCLFLLAETNKDLIGQVRFDTSNNEAVISISIAEKYRGLGVGRVVLRKALNRLKHDMPDIRVVRAYIKGKNISSVKYFSKSKFQPSGKLLIKNQKALEYSYYL